MKSTTLLSLLLPLTTTAFAAPIPPSNEIAGTEDGDTIVIGSRSAEAEPKRPAFISYVKGYERGFEKREAEAEAEAEPRPPVFINYTWDAYPLPPDGGAKKRDAMPEPAPGPEAEAEAEPVPPVVINYDWMAYEPKDAGA
jgi:hypothetical protein